MQFIREHHDKRNFGEKVKLRNLDIEQYKNGKGFELIAAALGIEYPTRPESYQHTFQTPPSRAECRASLLP